MNFVKKAYIKMKDITNYMHGFCKEALDCGVNPVELLKFAKERKSHARRNALGELLGTVGGHYIGGAGIGALIGGLAKGKLGALAGLASGAALTPFVDAGGSLAAAFTPRRTRRDQAIHDRKGRFLVNTLIPGIGSYNGLKRIGSTFGED